MERGRGTEYHDVVKTIVIEGEPSHPVGQEGPSCPTGWLATIRLGLATGSEHDGPKQQEAAGTRRSTSSRRVSVLWIFDMEEADCGFELEE